jgi:putative protease
MGFKHILCRNLGQIPPIKDAGLIPHGDFAFNAANSQTLTVLKDELADITLSYELTLQQIRRLHKPMESGIIIYGRLPLMETENCILKNVGGCKNGRGGTLTDRTGRSFPIACNHDCGNVLFNSTPLFLADRNREWKEANITFGRFIFTEENPKEISRIIDAYLHGGEPPESYTRGLYYRGVH